MTPDYPEYRTLDKDLTRLDATEAAMRKATRPVLWVGPGAFLVALIAFLIAGQGGGTIAGTVVVGYLALGIGANDLANSMGAAVGAGGLRPRTAIVLAILAIAAGAFCAAAPVVARLSDGIVQFPEDAAPKLMLAAVMAAALWVNGATWLAIPVSTTFSMVGAITGAGLGHLGARMINWPAITAIATGWILTPVAAAGIAAGIYLLFRKVIDQADDRTEAAKRSLSLLIAGMGGLFTIYITQTTIHRALPTSLAVAFLVGIGAYGIMRWRLGRMPHLGKRRVQQVFRQPLILSAVAVAFAHGSNDAANIAAPLAAILVPPVGPAASFSGDGALMLAVGAMALGTVLSGRRLMTMVGSEITRLNPARAFCVTSATAVMVLLASALGFPVSTTYIAVGGIFGVGLAREWHDRKRQKIKSPLPHEERRRRHLVRLSHLSTILAAWVLTVPCCAALAAALGWIIR